jgi:hypothetical protein
MTLIKKNLPNWVHTTISIIFGAILTIGATWYSIEKDRKNENKALEERELKVKENVTTIIEEHILNKDTIDLISIERIKNIRCKEEKLSENLSIYDLISKAEYNIQNSNHLSFEKKREYSKMITNLFSQFSTLDTISNISKIRYPKITSKILNYFNEIEKANAKEELNILIQNYENEINKLELKIKPKKSFLQYISDSSLTIIVSSLGYLLFMYIITSYFKSRKKRKEQEEIFNKKVLRDRVRLKDKIDELINELDNKENSNEKNKALRKEIEYLVNRLKRMDNLRNRYKY